MSCRAAAVSSSGVPAGMSSTTWYSLLLSKGSILSTTPRPELGIMASATDSISATRMPTSNSQRRFELSRKGVRVLVKVFCRALVRREGPWSACPSVLVSLSASQGVTVKAMASEIAMPMLALIGIGLMYGPIRPRHKRHGQQGRDHGEGGQNGGAAHFVHRPGNDHRQRLARA